EYRPGSRSGTRYDPSAPETTTRCALVALFIAVTVAPGTAALVVSVTVPARLPKRSCAPARPAVTRRSPARNAVMRLAIVLFSLLGVPTTPVVKRFTPNAADRREPCRSDEGRVAARWGRGSGAQ